MNHKNIQKKLDSINERIDKYIEQGKWATEACQRLVKLHRQLISK